MFLVIRMCGVLSVAIIKEMHIKCLCVCVIMTQWNITDYHDYTHIFPFTGGVSYFCICPVFTCIHKITSIQAESARLSRIPLKDSVTEFLTEGGGCD